MNKFFWMRGGGSKWAGDPPEKSQKMSAGKALSNWEREFRTRDFLGEGNDYINFNDEKPQKGYKRTIKKAVEIKWKSNLTYQKHISEEMKQKTIDFLQKKYTKKTSYVWFKY